MQLTFIFYLSLCGQCSGLARIPKAHLSRNVNTHCGDADRKAARLPLGGVLMNQSLRCELLTAIYFAGKLLTVWVVGLLT